MDHRLLLVYDHRIQSLVRNIGAQYAHNRQWRRASDGRGDRAPPHPTPPSLNEICHVKEKTLDINLLTYHLQNFADLKLI